MNITTKIIITDTNIITDLSNANVLDKFAKLDNVYISDMVKNDEINSKTGNVTKSIASATADVKLNVSILGDVEAKQIVSTETFTDFVW